ncbi:FimV/HubP family polar landmark protein [Accumulibacter sp.]|uniref:FimV/HubP family polar landmark protein n=1 Tax=Accumulibacter sp. TaxID=2053492 RepID=UPI0025CEA452|nr:FimV/HubP family polar landmark protein [Accumulibacter sp.]MCM8593751.1 pilus assembly protein [Accumulibacter sp.]MCM8627713.1 pilus assembly protein [Accumulibacter sp.]MDS4047890.1 FimV/HubP family polar landmark protein [Accumulibacter sp.]
MPLGTEAAGLGKITVYSALGQPLRAELEVFATREELSGMRAQLASPEAFRQAGVDYVPSLSGISLNIDKRPNGQPVIRLTSSRPLNDPFIDLLVELNWSSGRLVREYTFLLDPPEFSAKITGGAPVVSRPTVSGRASVEGRADEERPPRGPARRARVERQPAEGGASYEVKPGDTLTRIASELRPEGISLDQMLLGLFQANPHAFDQGNINRLKAGKILSIPDQASLAAIPRGEARTTVVAQSADWGGYRRKLAGLAAESPAKDEGEAQRAGGRVAARVEDRGGLAAEPKDQLRVSRTDASGTRPEAGSRRGDEDLIAKEKALREANERLASLERNVAELQRLVEMKSQTLAEIERQATSRGAPPVEPGRVAGEAKAGAAAPAPAGGVAAIPAPVTAPAPVAAETPPTAGAPAKPVEPPVPEPVAKPEVDSGAARPEGPAAQPVEPPKPKVVPPPPVSEESGSSGDRFGGGTLLAAGAVAALLGAYWFIRRRREASVEAPQLEPSSTLESVPDSMATASVFRSTGGQSVDTSHSLGQTDFSQAGPESIDTDEVDPVAEADVYMAYGRDAQAEEILLEAKQKDPRRFAIYLKLLEIYHGRQDLRPFRTTATELFNATGGVGLDWEKAVAMGIQVDPTNPLFGAAVPPPVPPTALAAVDQPAPPGGDLQSLEDTLTRPESLLQAAAAAGVSAAWPAAGAQAARHAEAGAEPANLAELEFEIDRNENRPDSATDAFLETTLAFANTADATALDFDVGTPVSGEATSAGQKGGLRYVEDISSFEHTVLLPPEPEKEAPGAGAVLGFDFELSPEAPREPDWQSITLTQGASADASKFGESAGDALEFDVKLTESTVLGEGLQLPSFDLASISLDLSEPDTSRTLDKPAAAAPLVDFSFASDEQDTVVNPDFSVMHMDTEVNPQFTAESPGPEITSSEEVATKLDLARAYQEMGDLEGARELLQEVINEGDAKQRESAMVLLGQLRD